MKLVDKIGYILIYVAIVLWITIIILTPLKIMGVSQTVLDYTLLLSSFSVSCYISIKNIPGRCIDVVNKWVISN